MLGSEQGGNRELCSHPTMTGEVNDANVAVAKDVRCSRGQVLHLCGKKRDVSKAEDVLEIPWLWEHSVGLRLKTILCGQAGAGNRSEE